MIIVHGDLTSHMHTHSFSCEHRVAGSQGLNCVHGTSGDISFCDVGPEDRKCIDGEDCSFTSDLGKMAASQNTQQLGTFSLCLYYAS